MATFFESGTWVWIPDEDEVVLPAKAKSAFRLGERATVVLETGAVSSQDLDADFRVRSSPTMYCDSLPGYFR